MSEAQKGMKIFADFQPPNASIIACKPRYFLLSRLRNGRETLASVTLANGQQTRARTLHALTILQNLGHR